jgi:hypothetical protein
MKRRNFPGIMFLKQQSALEKLKLIRANPPDYVNEDNLDKQIIRTKAKMEAAGGTYEAASSIRTKKKRG